MGGYSSFTPMTEKSLQKSQSQAEKKPIIFDRNGNADVFFEAKHTLLVPDSLFEMSASLATVNKTVYRIDRKLKLQNAPEDKNIVIYAPFPLGLWAIHTFIRSHSVKLVLDKQHNYSYWRLLLLRLTLKNEKRRMGSDVFSPVMMRRLRDILSVADYYALTIGDWLSFPDKLPEQFFGLSKNIFWLTDKTPPQEISDFVNSDSF